MTRMKQSVPMDFLEIESWRDIRPIKGAGIYDRFACAPVCGDSLQDENIINGDWLILQLTPHADLGDLVVVRTPDGNTVKYLFPLDDDCVILRGANALYEDQIWKTDDIKIIAVVRRVERDLAGKRRGDIR